MVDYRASQRSPKLAHWLVSVLFSRVIQTYTLLSCDERRRQIPSTSSCDLIARFGSGDMRTGSVFRGRAMPTTVALAIFLPPARRLVILAVDGVRVDVHRPARKVAV